MKKLISITLCFLMILVLTSCGGLHIASGEEEKVSYALHESVGEAHNEVLTDLYAHFSDLKQSGTLPRDIDECRSHVRRFISGKQTMGYTLSVSETGEDLLYKSLLNRNMLRKAASNAELIDVLSDSLDIVSRHKAIFDSLCVILDQNSSSESKRQALENYYSYIDETVTDSEEKMSLMNGLGTIIHSEEYWNEHYDEWNMLFSDGMQKPCLGIVGAVGIIDGVGAVIGTLEGFRDTEPGEDDRAVTIVGRAVGEAAKTSTYAVLCLVLL